MPPAALGSQSNRDETDAMLSRTGIAFATGAMGMTAAVQTVSILLLRFLTDSIAISAATATLIIAGTHLYDALIDPVVGHASDRTSTRWGRRRPYLFFGSVLLPLALISLFNVPSSLSGGALLASLACLMLAVSTGGSLYKVAYAALSAEVCSSYHERSRLMAYRVCGSSIGLMLGSTIPSWLLAQWGTHRASYASAAWVVGCVVLFCCLAGLLLLPKDEREVEPPARRSPREYAQIAWNNRPFRIVCATHACFMIGVAAASWSNAHFTRHVLQASDSWLGTFYVLMVLASLFSLPAWLKAARVYDKKQTYLAALGCYGLLHLTWLWADVEEPLLLRCIRVVMIGLALGGVMLLAFSIIADVIRYDALQSGQRREGALSGIQSIVDRAFSVIGVVTIGSLLTASGYLASSDGAASVQPSGAISAIYAAFSIVPALSCAISMLILSKYQLTADMLGEGADDFAQGGVAKNRA